MVLTPLWRPGLGIVEILVVAFRLSTVESNSIVVVAGDGNELNATPAN